MPKIASQNGQAGIQASTVSILLSDCAVAAKRCNRSRTLGLINKYVLLL